MEITYTAFDLLMYLLLYAFLGWAAEVLCYAIRDKQFVNRGFLNLPFSLPYGISAVILMLVLPTLNHYPLFQFVQCWIVSWAVMSISDQFAKGVRRQRSRRAHTPSRRQRFLSALNTAIIALAYYVGFLVVHPLIFWVCDFLPDLLVRIVVIVLAAAVGLDFGIVLSSLRNKTAVPEGSQILTRRLANRLRNAVRRRLDRAYPGILEEQDMAQPRHVFALGICYDKLVWVFLASSFLGALIEMLFCRITAGYWMNRSSVLYGTFSFVWGFGAVLLTITLRRVAQKADRFVFLAGFLVGGVYEYLCSVFTELVFGTVFWDYSSMPLNIGGRTNVLYCVFWGLLAVVWVKVLYPPMSRSIEKIPALAGKIATWVIVAVMVCNGLLTAAAMIRYTSRQTDPTADTVIERFLDSRYDDGWMENRWPNMILAED